MWRVLEDNSKMKTWMDTDSQKTIRIQKVIFGKWIIVQSDVPGRMGPITKNRAEEIVQRLIKDQKFKSMGLEKNDSEETESIL